MENEVIAEVSKEDTSSDNKALPLIRGKITLAEALEEEDNMLLPLSYPQKRFDFFVRIDMVRKELALLIAHDLGFRAGETCELSHPRKWIHGSFNVCIPIDVFNWKKHPGKRLLLRLPLPYKTETCSDEKLRTEAATYLWMQQNCPHVPIPFLWAFALPGGQSFRRLENVPFIVRLRWYCQRFVGFFTGRHAQHPYVPIKRTTALEHGYLVLDYIESKDGTMLSESWSEDAQDPRLRQNLFRGLAQIMLSLSRIPQSRIGSWTVDTEGKLSLTNRPLFHHICRLENEGVPTGIPRTMTYDAADAFYDDLLSCHDNRILYQPNSILDEEDGFNQMACLFALRGLAPGFTDVDSRRGPFNFTLTDLHASNIFVDKDWNITCIIDLEWACSLPADLQGPPHWLTNTYEGDELKRFDKLRQEFMAIFKDEEEALHGHATYKTDLMNKGWQSGKFWYFHALRSPTGCYSLFEGKIRPLFASGVDMNELGRCLGPFWRRNAHGIVKEKLADKRKYESQLREVFADSCENND